jgi:hypothetical protein
VILHLASHAEEILGKAVENAGEYVFDYKSLFALRTLRPMGAAGYRIRWWVLPGLTAPCVEPYKPGTIGNAAVWTPAGLGRVSGRCGRAGDGPSRLEVE